MNTFEISNLKKDRAKKPGQLGSGLANIGRRIKGGGKMRAVATTLRATNVVPKTNVVHIKDEREEAHEFSAVILPFSAGELARAAKRTKEVAKHWKAGLHLPSTWSIWNMAQDIPDVRNHCASKLGISRHPEFLSPKVLTVVMATLYQVAHQQNPDGEAARKALRMLGGAPE